MKYIIEFSEFEKKIENFGRIQIEGNLSNSGSSWGETGKSQCEKEVNHWPRQALTTELLDQ